MIHYIYKIVNSINNKSYIGYTSRTDPKDRWKGHLSAAKWCDRPLYRAIRKYGVDAFTFTVIYCSLDGVHTLSTMEHYFICDYRSHITNDGYNLSYGGESNVGWVPSTATRQMWSRQRTGRKLSLDRVTQMSTCALQRYVDNPELKVAARERAITSGARPPLPTADSQRKSALSRVGGHIHTTEHKKRLSEAMRNDSRHPLKSPEVMNKRKQTWKASGRGCGEKNGNAVFCTITNPTGDVIGSGFLSALCDRYQLPFSKFLAASRHGNPLVRGEWKGWMITRINGYSSSFTSP